MKCCQCQGIEKVFDTKYVNKELKKYRNKGPVKTTRILLDALKESGIAGMSLLDIGGGVGVIQHELLRAGASTATNVEASAAFIAAAKSEAQRRNHGERTRHVHGDFVEVGKHIDPADIVTLDRVICCYHDMSAQVSLSAEQARKLYGLVYPRDTWWTKLAFNIQNFLLWVRRNPFRIFIHPTEAVDSVVSSKGLRRRFYRKTAFWQIVIYAR